MTPVMKMTLKKREERQMIEEPVKIEDLDGQEELEEGENMLNNDRVMEVIKERLDIGAKTYGKEIPLNGEGGRDNLKESLDEALDLAVYLSATILELLDKRLALEDWGDKKKPLSVDVDKQKVMITALNDYGSEAYREGHDAESILAFDLAKEIKERGGCEKCD